MHCRYKYSTNIGVINISYFIYSYHMSRLRQRSGVDGEGSTNGPLDVGGYQLSCADLAKVPVGFHCQLGGTNMISL